MSNKKRAIVFVHYDKNDIVDDYVYHYIKELQDNSSYLVFVSTAQLSESEVSKLSNYCSEVIVRDNVGYDFMSYKIGLESFDYKKYDEVIICNDSVYGPFYPLKLLFKHMYNDKCNFWGVTDSAEINYHLQSYFLVFKKDVIQSDIFKMFWDKIEVLNNKKDIIKRYEVGLTKHLLSHGFSSSSYSNLKITTFQKISVFMRKLTCNEILKKIREIYVGEYSLYGVGKVNSTHYFWRDLLLRSKIPFIKIELLRDNPKHINIDDFESVINKTSKYNTKLIKSHLNRMR